MRTLKLVGRVVLVGVVTPIVCFVVFLAFYSAGYKYVLEAAVVLLTGWWSFLGRVGPSVRPAPAEVTAAAVSFLIVLFGTHWFGRWLSAGPTGWPWRRTVRVVGVVVLMFVCGTAAIGVTHQVSWLARSPEPMTEPITTFTKIGRAIPPSGSGSVSSSTPPSMKTKTATTP